jgi:AbrB family looped-hinge helix DNA binding protein
MSVYAVKLSSKGQLVIPKELRERCGWSAGSELVIEGHGDVLLLRARREVNRTTLEEVLGCLHYDGPPLSVEQMDDAIARAVTEDA